MRATSCVVPSAAAVMVARQRVFERVFERVTLAAAVGRLEGETSNGSSETPRLKLTEGEARGNFAAASGQVVSPLVFSGTAS
jgi:hypothetical protein